MLHFSGNDPVTSQHTCLFDVTYQRANTLLLLSIDLSDFRRTQQVLSGPRRGFLAYY